jgi:hypothetical protein
MPSSAMKASPTVSAHAILSRRRRRHDIILIAPFALSPSNLAVFKPPTTRTGRLVPPRQKEGPAPTPWARGETTRSAHTSCVGKRYWGPRQSGRQFTEWGRHSGSTRVRNKDLRDDSAADQRYTGIAYRVYRRQVGGASVSAFACRRRGSHWKSFGPAILVALGLLGETAGSAQAQCAACATEWSGGSVINLGVLPVGERGLSLA